MNLNVDLIGMPRMYAKAKGCTLEMPTQATYRDIVRTLASMYPDLAGTIIVKNTFDLEKGYMLLVEGIREIAGLESQPKEGEQITLMAGSIC